MDLRVFWTDVRTLRDNGSLSCNSRSRRAVRTRLGSGFGAPDRLRSYSMRTQGPSPQDAPAPSRAPAAEAAVPSSRRRGRPTSARAAGARRRRDAHRSAQSAASRARRSSPCRHPKHLVTSPFSREEQRASLSTTAGHRPAPLVHPPSTPLVQLSLLPEVSAPWNVRVLDGGRTSCPVSAPRPADPATALCLPPSEPAIFRPLRSAQTAA